MRPAGVTSHSGVGSPAPTQAGPGADDGALRLAVLGSTVLHAKALGLLLQDRPDLEVGWAGHDAEALADHLARSKPAVLVVDGLGAQAEKVVTSLARKESPIKIVVLAAEEMEAAVLRWGERGGHAVVPGDAGLPQLEVAIRDAVDGHLHCSPEVAGSLLHRLGELAAEDPPGPSTMASSPGRNLADTHGLTPREEEVLGLLSDGLSNKGIARRLGLSVSTVKNHVHRILAKVGASSRVELLVRTTGADRRSDEPPAP